VPTQRDPARKPVARADSGADSATDSGADSGADSAADDEGPRDLAAGALRSARAMSSGRTAGRPARLRRGRREGGGYSGARPDERDPAPLGSILGNAITELGWVAPLAHARLMGQWSSVVGADIAARCQPVSLVGGELKVAAESTAWATQLRMMAPQILARIARELPAGLVTKLIITGPSAPSWKHGPWSMHGGRGARDTYG
jgi:predicted nucleic acid-binding Zn ribbon protein